MIANSDSHQIKTSEGLTLVSSNPQPSRELQYPNSWLLYSHDREFRVVVSHEPGSRSRVTHKKAAARG